jgi:hypothetical protein
MGHTVGHHPGPRPLHVEKRRLAFPPHLFFGPEHDEALAAVFLYRRMNSTGLLLSATAALRA